MELPREWMCHFDIWMGCGPGMFSSEGGILHWDQKINRSLQKESGEWSGGQNVPGKGSRLYTVETSELGLQEPNCSWRSSRASGLWLLCEKVRVLVVLPDFTPKPRHSYIIVYFISIILPDTHQEPSEVSVAAPFHRWGARGLAMSPVLGSLCCACQAPSLALWPQEGSPERLCYTYPHDSGAKDISCSSGRRWNLCNPTE